MLSRWKPNIYINMTKCNTKFFGHWCSPKMVYVSVFVFPCSCSMHRLNFAERFSGFETTAEGNAIKKIIISTRKEITWTLLFNDFLKRQKKMSAIRGVSCYVDMTSYEGRVNICKCNHGPFIIVFRFGLFVSGSDKAPVLVLNLQQICPNTWAHVRAPLLPVNSMS